VDHPFLFDRYPALLRDTACLHDYIIVNNFSSASPAFHFLNWSAQRNRQLFISAFETVVTQSEKDLSSFRFTRATIVYRLLCSWFSVHLLLPCSFKLIFKHGGPHRWGNNFIVENSKGRLFRIGHGRTLGPRAILFNLTRDVSGYRI
jgi:hypothetical protein